MKRKAASFGIILFSSSCSCARRKYFWSKQRTSSLVSNSSSNTASIYDSVRTFDFYKQYRLPGPDLRTSFCRLFRTSENASFAIIAGFLCGYPMGAKVTADLLRQERISKTEGQYLLSFCNNTSPMFIISYIVWQNFQDKSLLVPTLFLLFLTPILSSILFYPFYHKKQKTSSPEKNISDSTKKQAPHICIKFQMLDTCIMNSFEAITKIGGYIMLFSILISLLSSAPLQKISLLHIALPFLEITNGISMLCAADTSCAVRFVLTLSLTAFGGVCSIAQTNCMLEGTGLSIFPYFLQKLITAILCGMLSALFFQLFV